MSENNDQNQSQEWIDELAARLKEGELAGKTDVEIKYQPISLCFPGGPHPHIMGLSLIDWNNLKLWANKIGWDVKSAPERTHINQKDIPMIRFTKINQG